MGKLGDLFQWIGCGNHDAFSGVGVFENQTRLSSLKS
jgi:hypothetical protein